MDVLDLHEELSGNAYPGRGIVIGKVPAGTHAVIAYFIMGRSVNSRNRVFELDADGQGMHTKAYDEALVQDPALIIYAPVKVLGYRTIVTNGDQTDTIWGALSAGQSFEDALRTRTFEPDAPNYTPRISGIVHHKDHNFDYQLSILKSFNGDEKQPQRFFFAYTAQNGLGHLIHTYRCDGNPRIPSFEGEPKPVGISGDISDFTDSLWQALHAENKVSLFVRYIDLRDGTTQTKIVNKLGKA